MNNRVVVVQLDFISNVSIIGSGLGSGIDQFNTTYDLFIVNTSLYVNDCGNHRVKKISLNGSDPVVVLDYDASFWPIYLYIRHDGSVYLSDAANHRVVHFRSNSTNFAIVAGTGVAGPNNDQLNTPYGIFVNDAGTVYVADCHNHRIMKWFPGASSGFIVAGNGTAGASLMQLDFPTQVIVDSHEYMYISEAGNSRITRWLINSTFGECIAACSGVVGTTSTQLQAPHSLTFDSNGSLYVADSGNNRVQKFQILPYYSEYSIN
jgi:hypothetical protein